MRYSSQDLEDRKGKRGQMNENEIKQKLAQLSEFQSQLDIATLEKQQLLDEFQSQLESARIEKQQLLDEIYTPEIKARVAQVEANFSRKTEIVTTNIEALEADFSGKTEVVTANIEAIEAEVKQAVIERGASVKGTFFHAVFRKGRVSWDTKSLDEYATTHRELLSFRKEGEPSVSLRKVKA
jgi:hypothetical protein